MRIRKEVWIFPVLALLGILFGLFVFINSPKPPAENTPVIQQGAPAEGEPLNPLKSE